MMKLFKVGAPNPKLLLLAGLTLLLLNAGCGGGGGGSPQAIDPPVTTSPPPEPPKGLLVQVGGLDDLRQKAVLGLQNYFDTRFDGQVAEVETSSSDSSLAGSSDRGDSDGNGDQGEGSGATDEIATADAARTETVSFTTTYTLENNVDEYDFVKYDGDRLFIAPTRGLDCCFGFVEEVFFEDDAIDPAAEVGDTAGDPVGTAEGPGSQEEDLARGIRVLATRPDAGLAESVTIIPLEESQSVEGLYLVDSSLIALTSDNWWGRYGDNFSDPDRWSAGTVGLDIYDVGPDANYDLLHRVKIEGVLINSRRTEAGIFVVTRHTPDIEGLNYYPATQEEFDSNQNLLEGLDAEDFLPLIEKDGLALDVVSPTDCFALNTEDEDAPVRSGSPTVSLVLQIDPQTGDVLEAACLLEPIDGVYLTTERLYFTQNVYEGDVDTIIHQFNLAPSPQYAGSARLSGGLFLGDNNDYRINASDGNLRVVLSQWQDDAEDRIDHTLYILRPDDDAPTLEVLGQLPSAARPEEIGKPNEDLYGVRFVGDRAYFVTFERIDPLYVIDLSEPTDPFIAGSLEVPGFSDFLHPVSESVLLGLGRSDSRLTKLEFFDVSDLASPQSLGALTLDDSLSYSYSQAEYNRKAFTYWRQSPNEHRMAIPVEGYLKEAPFTNLARLYLFDIVNPDSPSTLALTSPGFLEVTAATGVQIWGQHRSILQENAVFWIIEQAVITALWDNPAQSDIAQ